MLPYVPYVPLSKKNDCDGFISSEMFDAQKLAINQIPKKIRDNWDQWISEKLNVSVEELFLSYSSEQIDSIGLAILSIEKKEGFIIGDETGKGKGRILSGISRYAYNNNLNIIFFTEKKDLFSDFYRDLTHTNNLHILDSLLLFHSKAKIYNIDNEIVYKSSLTNLKKILNKEKEDENYRFIFTTYSQISSSQTKKIKLDFFEKNIKNSIIILDECHNAAGDSNTQKFIENLINKSKAVIYSSATFMKKESELSLYKKAIPFDKKYTELFSRILSVENNFLLRQYLTLELTKNGKFWRREHQPFEAEWTHLIAKEPEIKSTILEYSQIIDIIFEILNALSKEPALQNNKLQSVWYTMGAIINRLSRNLILILKIPTLIKNVKATLDNDIKAVIVIDSTFNSIIEKIISHKTIQDSYLNEEQEDSDSENDSINIKELTNKNFNLSFMDILDWLQFNILNEYLTKVPEVNPKIQTLNNELKLLIQNFPKLPISPIDFIKEELMKHNIESGEISGRTFNLIKQDDDTYQLKPIEGINRVSTVANFNNGKLNVIILTRAGASGISLHSSKDFKDQRKRALFELEITNRPTFRLQFIGRVRRRNQVCEPDFYTVCTDLPFEKRIIVVEKQKLKILQSHMGTNDNKIDSENMIDFYTLKMDSIAKNFLQENHYLAYKLGINLKSEEPYYFIDSILKRSIILEPTIQDDLFNYLQVGAMVENSCKNILTTSIDYQVTNIENFWHQLNESEMSSLREEFRLYNDKTKYINNFKYNWVGFLDSNLTHQIASKNYFSLEQELKQNNIEKFQTSLNEVIKYYKNKFLHNEYSLQEQNLIKKNITSVMNLKLGNYIELNYSNQKIYGYIENVTIPDISNLLKYPTHYLMKIRLMNPDLNKKLLINDFYFISLHELLSCSFKISQNTTINWTNFERLNKKINREKTFLIGHPLWIHYLNNVYKLGESKYIQINNGKYLIIEITGKNKEEIKAYKKPLINYNTIMEKLISKEINKLTTTFNDDKPIMRIEPVTGGYNLFIHQSITRNYAIFDFGLKNRLGIPKTHYDYNVYHIIYKQMRGILAMLELRNIQWFIEK